MSEFEICPFDAPLGAEICGLDIGEPLDPETVERVSAAWHEHLVLLFRGQDLTDQQHFDFTEQFGALDHPPKRLLAIAAGKTVDDDEPLEINVVSNVIENGEPIGVLGHGEAFWHSDSTFVERPPAASLLRSLEVPDSGGDTHFMNMYKALETLPGDLREAIAGKSSKHDPAYSSSGERRAEFTELDPTKSPRPHSPARADPSQHRPQGAVPGPPAGQLHRRPALGRKRGVVGSLSIRLTPMTATCRVPPLSRVKLGIGWSRGVARDAEQ